MKITKINENWALQAGGFSPIPGMQAQQRTVNLPHDFVIESDVRSDSKNGSNTGFFNGGTYTYSKMLTVPAEWDGQRILLSFDGVMGSTKLTVNGQLVLVHHYGYTPFQADISPYLYYGEENRISLTVSNNAEQNARWYTGGGIYRDVTLLTAPQVHIAPNGLFAHTDHFMGEDAFITVQTSVENADAQHHGGVEEAGNNAVFPAVLTGDRSQTGAVERIVDVLVKVVVLAFRIEENTGNDGPDIDDILAEHGKTGTE